MFNDPNINDRIKVDGKTYKFSEASNAPGIIYAEIGRKAKVYRLHCGNEVFALKVFKPRYRSPEIVDNTNRIMKHRKVPGLAVTNRKVITPENNPELIEQNNAFAYSILMPWVEGKSWFNYVTGKSLISQQDSLRLAQSLLNTLSELEKRNLAHCDLSSSNFIFLSDYSHVELIDIEDMFGIDMKEPKDKSSGTGGYAPTWAKTTGLWEAAADRFSGGILISEILTWPFEEIRNAASGSDAYFAEGEFGNKSKRYRLLSERLGTINPQITELFKTTWFAESLEECPRIADWARALSTIRQPYLEVSPRVLNFGTLDLTVKPPAQLKASVKIKNAGGSRLVGQITSNVPWMTIWPREFSNLEGQTSEHSLTVNVNAPRRERQHDYSVKDMVSIKSNLGVKTLSGHYSIAFPEKRPLIWLYALIGLLSSGILAFCVAVGMGWVMFVSPISGTPTQASISDNQGAEAPQIIYTAPRIISSATPGRPSPTPTSTLVQVRDRYAYASASQVTLYQGPGLDYYLVRNGDFKRGERFTVLARTKDGSWLLCSSSNGLKGWLFIDWLDLSFDPSIVPTASSIPAIPPTPTRKPKQSH